MITFLQSRATYIDGLHVIAWGLFVAFTGVRLMVWSVRRDRALTALLRHYDAAMPLLPVGEEAEKWFRRRDELREKIKSLQ